MPGINVSSGSPYEGPTGFSRARRIGDIIAVAGTAPIGPDGKTVGPGDPYKQAKRCLEIIEKTLGDLGANLENIIRTRVFLTDASRWEPVARAHGEYFGDVKPACSFVEVSRFIETDWLVEIEADAVLSD
jgi:enamine deaminase RidA (YjgF/YER057c/UK114 family)